MAELGDTVCCDLLFFKFNYFVESAMYCRENFMELWRKKIK